MMDHHFSTVLAKITELAIMVQGGHFTLYTTFPKEGMKAKKSNCLT